MIEDVYLRGKSLLKRSSKTPTQTPIYATKLHKRERWPYRKWDQRRSRLAGDIGDESPSQVKHLHSDPRKVDLR